MLALLVVLHVGCDGAQHTPNAPSTSVPGFAGRVFDFATNMGVPTVTVSFGGKTAVTRPDGSYVLDLPAGQYEPTINGVRVGIALVNGNSYRGDFLVRTGTCVGRYGTVTDRRTFKAVAGATVGFNGSNATMTATDGWYRIDLGCPENGIVGFNTTFLVVSHPNYTNASQVVGRGVYGMTRLDVELDAK